MLSNICGYCRYHANDTDMHCSEYYCKNEKSENYKEYTEYVDSCDKFEDEKK